MTVTDNDFYAVHATFQQALAELTTVQLGLRELNTAAHHARLAVGVDSDGREQGSRLDRPVVTHFFLVKGFEHQVGILTDRPVLLRMKLPVQFRRELLYLVTLHACGLWRAYRSYISQAIVFIRFRAEQINAV